MSRNYNLAVKDDRVQRVNTHGFKSVSHNRNPAASGKKKVLTGFGIILILTLMAFSIFGRVEMSELYTQRAELEAQLTQAQNEAGSLEAEFTQKTGMTKVEEYAENNLGLHKLDKSQIEYVEVENDKAAEVVQKDESNVFVKIKDWFNSAMEYIGL